MECVHFNPSHANTYGWLVPEGKLSGVKMSAVFRTYPLSLLSGDKAIGLAIQLVPNQEQLGLL